MSWRKFLLVPRLAAVGFRRAPTSADAWESYWRDVATTGRDGDVLWDGAGERELAWWRATARRYLDGTLPVLDVGAGNGRLSRLLAQDFPAVLGVDLSPAAVMRARQESVGVVGVTFEPADIAAPGAGDTLLAELGPANVVVRGVFHVLDPADRRRAATELGKVLGARGSLLLLETNWRGDLLGYLEYLGGDNGRLPEAMARLIDYRLPRPAPFGLDEVTETFPAPAWTIVASGPVDIAPVRALGSASGRMIPGFHAVLKSGAAEGDETPPQPDRQA